MAAENISQALSDIVVVIRSALVRSGCVTASVADLPVTVEQWRKASRHAGRELERPVRTMLVGGDVTAVLTDYPRDEVERAASQQRLRAVVGAVAEAQ